MTKTTRSVRFLGDEKVEVSPVPLPACRPGESVVRVAISAICGSELPAYRAETPASSIPNRGHEVAGIVQAVGPECHLPVGQRVGVQVMSGCGRCGHCAAGVLDLRVAAVRQGGLSPSLVARRITGGGLAVHVRGS